MASKMKVVFELNSSQAPGNKIKLVVMHPLKRWVGIINQNNTFSLWNFEEKILIKSFSCNTLDDTPLMKGPVEVREIVFFDRHSLTESCGNAGTSHRSLRWENSGLRNRARMGNQKPYHFCNGSEADLLRLCDWCDKTNKWKRFLAERHKESLCLL